MTDDLRNQVAFALGIDPKATGDQRLDGDAVMALFEKAAPVIARLAGLPGVDILREVVDVVTPVLKTELRDIAIEAWNQRAEIRKYTDPSKYPPEKEYRVKLKEHSVTWTYRPYIEITVAGMPMPKKIPLEAKVTLTFSGPLLLIRGGRYRAIEFGTLKLSGVLTCAEIVLKEQAGRPHPLRLGRIALGRDGIAIGGKAAAA